MGSVARGCVLPPRVDAWWEGGPALGGLNDVDFCGGRLAVTAGQALYLDSVNSATAAAGGGGGSLIEHYGSALLTQARWWQGPAGNGGPQVLAVVEQGGGARAGAISLLWPHALGMGAFQRQRFAMRVQAEAWAVEWDPAGERLLVGMGAGDAFALLDLRAQRWLRPFPHQASACRLHLHSDCFAPCWLSPQSALLGFRNGDVRLADFRCPLSPPSASTDSSALPLVTKMGNGVDQLAVLRLQGGDRGVVASDRLGALRLVDMRVPGMYVCAWDGIGWLRRNDCLTIRKAVAFIDPSIYTTNEPPSPQGGRSGNWPCPAPTRRRRSPARASPSSP